MMISGQFHDEERIIGQRPDGGDGKQISRGRWFCCFPVVALVYLHLPVGSRVVPNQMRSRPAAENRQDKKIAPTHCSKTAYQYSWHFSRIRIPSELVTIDYLRLNTPSVRGCVQGGGGIQNIRELNNQPLSMQLAKSGSCFAVPAFRSRDKLQRWKQIFKINTTKKGKTFTAEIQHRIVS